MAFEQIIPFISGSKLETVLDKIESILTVEAANQLLQGDELAKAKGTLTLDTPVTDGDQFVVGVKTYTLEATLTDVDGNIQIGVDLATTQANIVASFDLSGTAGADYANLMTANVDVNIKPFDSTLNQSVLAAKLSGIAGNSIATTSTFAAPSNQFDAVTLGTTQIGSVFDPTQYDFKVVKEIHTRFDNREITVPLVNVYYMNSDVDRKNDKQDKLNKVTIHIDIYGKAATVDGQEGLTAAALRVNRTMMQIFYILLSPKYNRLGFPSRDENDKLIQFVQKHSISNMEKFQPEEANQSVENLIACRITYNVELNENLFDLQGETLDIINSDVTATTQ